MSWMVLILPNTFLIRSSKHRSSSCPGTRHPSQPPSLSEALWASDTLSPWADYQSTGPHYLMTTNNPALIPPWIPNQPALCFLSHFNKVWNCADYSGGQLPCAPGLPGTQGLPGMVNLWFLIQIKSLAGDIGPGLPRMALNTKWTDNKGVRRPAMSTRLCIRSDWESRGIRGSSVIWSWQDVSGVLWVVYGYPTTDKSS